MILTAGETRRVKAPDQIEFEPDVDEQDVTLCAYCISEAHDSRWVFRVASMQYGLAKEVLDCQITFPGFVVTNWHANTEIPGGQYLALVTRYLGNGFRVVDGSGAPVGLHAASVVGGTPVCPSHVTDALKGLRK